MACAVLLDSALGLWLMAALASPMGLAGHGLGSTLVAVTDHRIRQRAAAESVASLAEGLTESVFPLPHLMH